MGVLTTGSNGRVTGLQFSYTIVRANGDRERLEYSVGVTTTPCHFGGERYWFICPLVKNGRPCSRRVGTLHLPPGGKYFGCRHCYNLTYESVQSHDKRVDVLAQLPPELLLDMSAKGGLGGRMLALSGAMKAVGREKNRMPRRPKGP